MELYLYVIKKRGNTQLFNNIICFNPKKIILTSKHCLINKTSTISKIEQKGEKGGHAKRKDVERLQNIEI